MKYLQRILTIAFAFSLNFTALIAKANDQNDDGLGLANGLGKVIIVRHAIAPGTGDPDNFKLGDCSTQRNLDASGRNQALAMGDWLRSQGVDRARVYSSQWCRCKDTAELLKLGPIEELPALNSFNQRWEDKDSNMASLRDFLSKHPIDETLTILVTHQVTISALTGAYPRSGTGVMLTLNGEGEGEGEVGPAVQFK